MPTETTTATASMTAAGRRFPPSFRWGAATSAYQIEGAARADGRGESIWDRFCATPGAISDGSSGEVACDHYHRWSEDVALARRPRPRRLPLLDRLAPDRPGWAGAVNEAGLDFYDRLVDGLLAAGIAPAPTLYHWDLPQALQDRGGWRRARPPSPSPSTRGRRRPARRPGADLDDAQRAAGVSPPRLHQRRARTRPTRRRRRARRRPPPARRPRPRPPAPPRPRARRPGRDRAQLHAGRRGHGRATPTSPRPNWSTTSRTAGTSIR